MSNPHMQHLGIATQTLSSTSEDIQVDLEHTDPEK